MSKSVISMLIIFSCAVSLTGCGGNGGPATAKPVDQELTQEEIDYAKNYEKQMAEQNKKYNN